MAINATDDASRYLAFLERLNAGQTEAERDWLTLEFSLEWLAESVQELVWIAAVPHWFDQDFLAALLGSTPNEGDFATLLDLSFVEIYPERGHAVHERTRKLLLDRLWQNETDRYRTLSTRAAAYCERRDQRDTAWRVEGIYHWLVAEPRNGTLRLIDTGWEWQNPPHFAYDKVEALARATREHLDAGRLAERGKAWTLFWEAHLDKIYSRYKAAQKNSCKSSSPQTATRIRRPTA